MLYTIMQVLHDHCMWIMCCTIVVRAAQRTLHNITHLLLVS